MTTAPAPPETPVPWARPEPLTADQLAAAAAAATAWVAANTPTQGETE